MLGYPQPPPPPPGEPGGRPPDPPTPRVTPWGHTLASSYPRVASLPRVLPGIL